MKRLLLCFAASLVLVSCQNMGPDRFVHHISEMVQNELQLTPDQKSKWNDLVTTVKTVIQAHQKAEADQSKQIEALIQAPKLDQAAMRSALDERFASGANLRSADLDQIMPVLAAFLDSLTPDQKAKLIKKHQQMVSVMAGWK
jgi:Spy/CpxP family protein refolding chaperone